MSKLGYFLGGVLAGITLAPLWLLMQSTLVPLPAQVQTLSTTQMKLLFAWKTMRQMGQNPVHMQKSRTPAQLRRVLCFV